ncbi:MAG: hypothetical protein K0U64_08790 [Actinomycetia bacterium]|nr:hypothetical protein [Actinomycetes bacterium]
MSANPPQPPTSGPMPTPQAKRSGSSGNVGWMVGTAIFAITTVIAIVWGLSRASDLQDQVDALNSQLSQQTQSSQTAQSVADSQISQLQSDIATLEGALKGLQKLSGSVLKSVEQEYTAVESQLEATQAAADELKKERDAAQQDSAAIAGSYTKAQQELALTQAALAQLLRAVAVEVATDPAS